MAVVSAAGCGLYCKERPTRLQVLQTLSRKANTEKKKEKDPKKIWQLQPKSYDSKYSNVPMQTFLRYTTYYVILIHSTGYQKLHDPSVHRHVIVLLVLFLGL